MKFSIFKFDRSKSYLENKVKYNYPCKKEFTRIIYKVLICGKMKCRILIQFIVFFFQKDLIGPFFTSLSVAPI
ncbi:MAG TPA: hypothetical protein DHU75_09050 [Rikenellaceae bacterium]|nr:hypothetical protein [Rikenellaceae bacterium]